jgi:hypothetical protein
MTAANQRLHFELSKSISLITAHYPASKLGWIILSIE